MTIRIAFQEATRAAAVTMLRDYALSVGLGLQAYRARPDSIFTPCAFVERMGETYEYPGQTRLRTPRCEVMVLFGRIDEGPTVDARDAFVDSFLDWVTDNFHAAGGNTLLELRRIEDEPDYVPTWLPEAKQKAYYGVRLILEGYAGG